MIKKKFLCNECNAELDPFDVIYSWENGWVCETCMEGFIDELMLDELAEMLGSVKCTVEDLNGGN